VGLCQARVVHLHTVMADPASPRPVPVLDLVGAIRLDPDFRMEDVLRALDSMTPEELEELATLLDEHDAAVRRRARVLAS
jgi:hypothetical protein